MLWEILGEGEIISTLLKNRGIKTDKDKKEFFNPTNPTKVSLKSFAISELQVKKAIARIKEAKKRGEHVIVYGDYDADGINGTAILWETINDIGVSVLPYIPERFSEGYGLNIESIKKLKEKDPKLGLIITVDHGVVAGNKIDFAREIGIDVIVTDHHQKGKSDPNAFALIYTDKISGSGVAWVFAREIFKSFNKPISKIESRLELAAIGTVADQLPLIGLNRAIVKYGLIQLSKTTRPGLSELFKNAGLDKEKIGVYEVGFIIAPRINSMGRLSHAIDSLRLICTRDHAKASEIAKRIGDTNFERQKIVEEVVLSARNKVGQDKVIVLADENYHEGVIGLAAARLVEEFYRPAIVLSKKGDVSKASARSIYGFNIIEVIRQLEDLYIEGGGHKMAAGFSIETKKIGEFKKRINKIAESLLTEEILARKLRIDLEVSFDQLDSKLFEVLISFEPTGLGNPAPTFLSRGVEVIDARVVGREAKHLKLKLKQNEQIFDAIFFGGGEMYSKLTPASKIDIVYQLEDNSWNGYKTLELRIKDLKVILLPKQIVY